MKLHNEEPHPNPPRLQGYGVYTSLLDLPTRLFDPPTPLKRGQMSLKVLFKGDLGGSTTILILYRDVCTP
jgi:hypothetical protein